ncbi:MAG TPA: hypothetical protein VGG22_02305 [Candidatus Baltobacteraceae bacterium]|jgi:hypothetical protein
MTQTVDGHSTASQIHWRTSFDAALDEARKTGKLVLLDFFNPG